MKLDVRGILQVDLLRWGVTALALLAAGFAGGRCSDRTGPIGREAELKIDSQRVAAADSVRQEAAAERRFQRWRDSVSAADSLQRAAQPLKIVRVQVAAAGTEAALAALREATDSLPALRQLVAAVSDSVRRLDSAQAAERAGWAAIARTDSLALRGDTAELGRRLLKISRLQAQVAAGIEAQDSLARRLRSWKLGYSCGAGAVVNQTGPHAGAGCLIGVSHEVSLHLPRLLGGHGP